jgi:hypothetical protein
MKTLGLILLHMMMTFSLELCQKDEEIANDDESAGAGKANIILTAGGEQYKINGPCGWASALGTKYIGANDAGNNLKTFSAFFNIDNPPAKTTTYTLVDDVNDEDPTHIRMNITEIRGSSLFEYTSTNTSGKLTLVVSGNKVTADLSGIILKPSTGENPIFPSLNTGAFSKTGTLSGTLEFEK